MKLAVIAITKNGVGIAEEIISCKEEIVGLNNQVIDIYISDKFKEEISQLQGLNIYSGRLKNLVDDIFHQYDGIIFIMALGIVVRMIADCIEDKRSDPAVVTIDETKQFVISTLSGHLGGANELTSQLAKLLKANPVITTATDSQGKSAIDMLAKDLDCKIEPFANLTKINAAIVNGDEVNIFTDYNLDLELTGDFNIYSLDKLNEKTSKASVIISNQQIKLTEKLKEQPYLWLKPRNLVLGIGCRRGISKERIALAVEEALKEAGLSLEQVKAVATIDLKADEEGLVVYAREQGLDLNIISREEIKTSDLEFTTSEFVKKAIGVGGVCEPVALLSGKKMELLLKKRKYQGVTVAIAQERSM
ncbi:MULTISPECIES: cobalt-precorrin 5A hydrolase [unclassified Candidatus Frackibacter]|uniref:cobalt-precorrin 5A hydrolase n=1 Tax=unclassified Candidatus Frackibacter TaxID=2648818 RepID=UPI000791314D|nr:MULTISPECIES: cobalt-precorrin 5A hydrolase [unclassified Candidatus Frackibacter]KXS43885.1 MAG: cobalt-precorrin 5A hydrolase [Candidatus Frackibacter sp. T328-2]SDC33891.1 cobalt-precorrin 5A acetaldehyde-lyase [Candidatus Frackibacter sp. WG11]SEM57307.1 cobalt-precorrin 5A acetaldehyde-lyase [Candidatus Frackibacter sp. WG12]SFL69959.1 cobalt-precorrin 5A acetaldehyde-lyase [Candidatus Frackibacter sp. WG13]